ncbi:hypothetical protein NQ318_005560 [Aromia moschata]|uniref:Uncharacterized protein n=1 Tax=Aromia moschata TaxID=1265417 RepID=A0AAV8XGW2_9CUCU|nr:hypothetical protein NQ318_005560 [Aromia moschata]
MLSSPRVYLEPATGEFQHVTRHGQWHTYAWATSEGEVTVLRRSGPVNELRAGCNKNPTTRSHRAVCKLARIALNGPPSPYDCFHLISNGSICFRRLVCARRRENASAAQSYCSPFN